MHLESSFVTEELFIILLQLFFFKSLLMRKVMYIFALGEFLSQLRFPAGGNPVVWPVTLGNHRCWEPCPLPTLWADPVHLTVAGLLKASGRRGGAKALISEPVGLLYSMVLCPILLQPS